MSDFTITHGHFLTQHDRIQAEAEYEAWIDSQAADPLPVPTCGMCSSFVSDRKFKTTDGKEFISPSHCKAKAFCDIPALHKATDEACPLFDYDCPF